METPLLDDASFWEEKFAELIGILRNPDEYHSNLFEIYREFDRINWIKSELVRLFPKYDKRYQKKPEIIPPDIYWWNGIESFVITAQTESTVTVSIKSYVGGTNYDYSSLTLTYPDNLIWK